VCYGIANRKETPCIVCGSLILASANAKTCSRTCANKNRSGIKYTGRSPKDKVKDERAIKLRMFASKGEKCERCGYNKKEILNVHHKDRNHGNNAIENLELLCLNCHAEEHYLKGSWLGNTLPD
jgi:5-methylcytosine-specific restriction endonuclease McrA